MATFKVTFLPAGKVVEVDPAKYPYGSHGEAGSILDIALAHGVEIEHACGGANVCGTCAVAVVAGMKNLSKASDDELDTIERTTENKPELRLACQAVVKGDVTVKIG
jgi:ferredoxin, 2Fe-2S